MYAQGSRDEGLGIAPVIVGAGISVGSKLIAPIFGGNRIKTAVAARTAEHTTAAAFAEAGHIAGAQLLQGRSGRFNTVTLSEAIPGIPGASKGAKVSPWSAGDASADQFMKDDAYNKYLALGAGSAASAGVDSSGIPTTPGGPTVVPKVASAAVSPMMIVIGIGSAVMLTSLFKRR